MITFTRPEVWIPALLSFVLTAAFTPIVARIARITGMVAAPKKDRWHSKPTALLGGMAIFASVVTVVLWRVDIPPVFSRAILPAAALLFLIGLIDDIVTLRPYQKLVMQIIAAAIVVNAGLVLPWTASQGINLIITLVWLVGITNAVNMLDNMDGLAAGVAAVAGFFLTINFFHLGQVVEGTVIAVLAASLCGFLLYNTQPASIFMGDCGSMFIGFFLASTALLTTSSGRTRSFLPVIAVPVLTLLIPIFDTTFVTLLRKLSGRAASQGGRDHTSHRLVALGLSERRAVLLLYTLAAISGYLSTQVRHLPLYESVMYILGFTIVLTMVGAYLADVKVYPADADLRNRPIMAFLLDMSHKTRVFETLMDAGLIVIAYYAAWSLRFGRLGPTDPNMLVMVKALPMVIAVKTGVFLLTGVYRGLWRYTSVHDLIGIARSVLIASVAAAAIQLVAFPEFGFRTRFFLLDMLLLLMLVTTSRIAFRVARRMLAGTSVSSSGRPVAIYGAGHAGELLLREIFNNSDLGYRAVCLIDDDPKKRSKVVHGLKVYSGDALREVCETFGVEEVLISTSKLTEGHRRALIGTCERIGIPLRQMRIALTPLTSWQQDPLAEQEPMAAPGPRIPVRAHGSTMVVGEQTARPPLVRPAVRQPS